MKDRILAAFLVILSISSSVIWQKGSAQSWSSPPPGISSLKIHAHPIKAVTSRQDEQTLYMIVQDQNLIPVQGVEVTVDIHMPDGTEQKYIVINPTNSTGITQISFPVSVKAVGLVILHVQAQHEGLEAQTSTSFWIWW